MGQKKIPNDVQLNNEQAVDIYDLFLLKDDVV